MTKVRKGKQEKGEFLLLSSKKVLKNADFVFSWNGSFVAEVYSFYTLRFSSFSCSLFLALSWSSTDSHTHWHSHTHSHTKTFFLTLYCVIFFDFFKNFTYFNSAPVLFHSLFPLPTPFTFYCEALNFVETSSTSQLCSFQPLMDQNLQDSNFKQLKIGAVK